RELADALAGEIDLIVGGHSHDLLPHGEWRSGVLIAQAGMFGEHLGRIDLDDDGVRASLISVTPDVPSAPELLAVAEREERQLEASLSEVIAELDRPLDARWIADVVRRRMDADVGLATSGAAIDRPLPPGPLQRGDLWEACSSTGNPGAV